MFLICGRYNDKYVLVDGSNSRDADLISDSYPARLRMSGVDYIQGDTDLVKYFRQNCHKKQTCPFWYDFNETKSKFRLYISGNWFNINFEAGSASVQWMYEGSEDTYPLDFNPLYGVIDILCYFKLDSVRYVWFILTGDSGIVRYLLFSLEEGKGNNMIFRGVRDSVEI